MDLCQRGHVVDRLLHVPHLVRVDHEHRTGRTRVLPCEPWAAWQACGIGLGRDVLQVVDDRANQSAAPQVVREVCAHFHFEVVESGLDGFLCQPGDLLV